MSDSATLQLVTSPANNKTPTGFHELKQWLTYRNKCGQRRRLKDTIAVVEHGRQLLKRSNGQAAKASHFLRLFFGLREAHKIKADVITGTRRKSTRSQRNFLLDVEPSVLYGVAIIGQDLCFFWLEISLQNWCLFTIANNRASQGLCRVVNCGNWGTGPIFTMGEAASPLAEYPPEDPDQLMEWLGALHVAWDGERGRFDDVFADIEHDQKLVEVRLGLHLVVKLLIGVRKGSDIKENSFMVTPRELNPGFGFKINGELDFLYCLTICSNDWCLFLNADNSTSEQLEDVLKGCDWDNDLSQLVARLQMSSMRAVKPSGCLLMAGRLMQMNLAVLSIADHNAIMKHPKRKRSRTSAEDASLNQ